MTAGPAAAPVLRPTRRQVLGFGAGAAAALAGSALPAVAQGGGAVVDLVVNEGDVPMVDGTMVYRRGYGDQRTSLGAAAPSLTLAPRVVLRDGTVSRSRSFPLRATLPPKGRPSPAGAVLPDGTSAVHRRHWASVFPRRTIVAESGSRLTVRLHNNLPAARGPVRFVLPGVVALEAGPGPTSVAEAAFDVPAPGTYVFSDPGEDGLGVPRALGLYGVLLVVPAEDPWRVQAVQQRAGGPRYGVEFERQWLWICSCVDPRWSAAARRGERIDPSSAEPRYFTLNDRSGFASIGVTDDDDVNLATHEETVPAGSARRSDVTLFRPAPGQDLAEGQPGQVLRLVNAGVASHQLHFHGNHVWEFRRDNVDLPDSAAGASVDPQGRVRLAQWADVVELVPLSSRDVVLPLKRPPDVLERIWREGRACDWHFPMHCHAEMSQTAGGGAYPGGLVADWVLAAPAAGGA